MGQTDGRIAQELSSGQRRCCDPRKIGAGLSGRQELDSVPMNTLVSMGPIYKTSDIHTVYIHRLFYFSNPDQTLSTYENNKRTLVLWLNEGHSAS